jgi:uncharacterized Tic20 family protein
MNEKKRNDNAGGDGRFEELYVFKALSRMGALIQAGSLPFGAPTGPLLLWLMRNDPDEYPEPRDKDR